MKENEKPGTPAVGVIQNPSPTVRQPAQDLRSIYVSEEPFAKEIEGVLFRWKELSGEEIVELTKEMKKDLVFDDAKFIRKLVSACVIEPQNLIVGKLKPLVYTLLSAEIQASFGLTEMVQKNLEKKFGLSPASMQSPITSTNE